MGLLSEREVGIASKVCADRGEPLIKAVRNNPRLTGQDIATVEARLMHSARIDPVTQPPDIRLLDRIVPAECLRMGVLPWRKMGGQTIVLAAAPPDFAHHLPTLTDAYGPVRLSIASDDQLKEALRRVSAHSLAQTAERSVPLDQSCRSWQGGWLSAATGALCALGMVGMSISSNWTITLTFCAIIFWTLANSLLKLLAILAHLFGPMARLSDPAPARLPVVTVMVPLFRESEIAARLIRRLTALDYPADLLDICLLLEQDDVLTRTAVARTNLPRTIRAIVVPTGLVRTKPRALNYGLNFARGTIIGVYDAEDAPDPQQIRKIVARFANASPQVACLQGVLDFYNARRNWLSRCFALEYATWFRIVLPGLERLGLIIPLGGTTLFFRRSVLEKLGGWDAHNVTEDADLGVRLARNGYRTELIMTVTGEEANCRAWPWVKQRSRWLKGYAITYIVHMRQPMRLLRDIGPRRFIGFQVQFLGTLCQFAMAPLLWSLWALPLGLPHPLASLLPGWGIPAMTALFIATEAITWTGAALGAHAAGRSWLIPWVPTLNFYFPLASLAAWKGLVELVHRPFYWDKTSHGQEGH